MNYVGFIPVLIKAFQEQNITLNKRLEDQDRKIEWLQNRLEAYQKREKEGEEEEEEK